MLFRSAVALFALSLAASCTGEECFGESGQDYAEGQVVVAFSESINDAADAENFFDAQGLALLEILDETPGDITAVAATPVGEECLWARRLSGEPEVDTATVRLILKAH